MGGGVGEEEQEEELSETSSDSTKIDAGGLGEWDKNDDIIVNSV